MSVGQERRKNLILYTCRAMLFPQEANVILLLLLLSCFSRVQLCAILETAAHQALLPLGFSRQEHWSGLPFPSQCMKVKSESEAAQSCLTLSDPVDCSLPGSSIHGIFQARVLEWGAVAYRSINLSILEEEMATRWVFLPEKSHTQRSLAGCSPGVKKSRQSLYNFSFYFSLSSENGKDNFCLIYPFTGLVLLRELTDTSSLPLI